MTYVITWEWTKLGTHACSNTSIFKTTLVFFSCKYGLMCYLCLCSHFVDVKLVDFLRLWRQFEQQWRYLTTQQLTKFLAIQPIRCRVWCSENPLHRSTLRFMAAVASGFCAIVAMHVLASITSLNYVGGIPCMPTHNQVVFTSRLPLTSRTW